MNITAKSLEVFLGYADAAADWDGMPLVGTDSDSNAARGNLTQLKQAGLIETQVDDGDTWLIFTEAGKSLASEHGIEI